MPFRYYMHVVANCDVCPYTDVTLQIALLIYCDIISQCKLPWQVDIS